MTKINLSPDVVDGIVFWTKNPIPMLARLRELEDYMYYFQFTITPYGNDIESGLPPKADLISALGKLSDTIGADRVIWRYDPILINERYSPEYHIRAFDDMARKLHRFTRKVTISFIDEDYRGVKRNIKELALRNFSADDKIALAHKLVKIASDYELIMESCAEKLDLRAAGIKPARCIDPGFWQSCLGAA